MIEIKRVNAVPIEELYFGTEVISTKGTLGKITKIIPRGPNDYTDLLEITWNNGKINTVAHKYLNAVTVWFERL